MKRAALVLAGACGSPSTEPTQLTVLAASSLTEAYSELEVAFEASHPGVDVVLSFAGSQTLATQIRHGIDADVFASASADHVRALEQDGLLVQARPFAHNQLVLGLPAGAPPLTLADLPRVPSLVVGTAEVPVGRYAVEFLDHAEQIYGSEWRQQVEDRVVSREGNVRLVASKVAMGEVAAGLLYASDVAALPNLRAVPLPADLSPRVRYHHGLVAELDSGEVQRVDLALEWLAFVEGPAGRATLQRWGFNAATDPA